MPKTSANDLRVGNVILFKNDLFKILNKAHVKPGKGGAFVQLELKGVTSKEKTYTRLRSSETADRVILHTREAQILSFDKDNIQIMDLETFEQSTVSLDLMTDVAIKFLPHSENILTEYADDNLIGLSVAKRIPMKIKETEGYIKGQTATGSFKPAILENDVKILIPQYLEAEQKIIVDTEELTFVEKAN